MDLAQVVSVKKRYAWTEGEWRLGAGFARPETFRFKVVAYDFGVKHNILRMLADPAAAIVTVVPATRPAAEVLALNAAEWRLPVQRPRRSRALRLRDGGVDSRTSSTAGHPTFGICLGHQIMGLAVGARRSR
jgi:carbamoyl-phosphate synthase small subunit